MALSSGKSRLTRQGHDVVVKIVLIVAVIIVALIFIRSGNT